MSSKMLGQSPRPASRLTIGGVPDEQATARLAQRGYRTLVDVRDLPELRKGLVRARAETLGLEYRWIPIPRRGLTTEQLRSFYQEIFRRDAEPVYAFSQDGTKLLALVLIFEAVAEQESLFSIEPTWLDVGCPLDQDDSFRGHLVDLIASGAIAQMVRDVCAARADLPWRSDTGRAPASRGSPFFSVGAYLRSLPFVSL